MSPAAALRRCRLLALPPERRALFYRLLARQLQAGVPLARALASMAQAGLHPPLRRLAARCLEAAEAGRTLADGLDEAVPAEDAAFIAAAERHRALAPLLERLAAGRARDPGLSSVFAANAYWLFLLALLGAMFHSGVPLVEAFEEINPAAADMPAAKAVRAVNGWGLQAAGALAALIAAAAWIRRESAGPLRAVLGGLGTEHARRCAIGFCDAAAMLLPRGVEHAELTAIAGRALGGGYARAAAARAAERLEQGEELAAALDGTVLDAAAAAVLAQLAPDGDPRRYPEAFETVADMLRALQRDFHAGARRLLGLACIAAVAGGLLVVITGVLETAALYQTGAF